ncbi:hypothetical protein Hamer_G000785 [Homarus americanus]|uniref:Uncharacterized protein n=1 Tax=Homarus americanus TaxID=6706 RepID=A0A8J5N291_HOMAM|nr:hypothetical protein Hamer_G000785 [Homarus americanus]
MTTSHSSSRRGMYVEGRRISERGVKLVGGERGMPSPCKKKSLLPACLRGRVPSDENVYSKTQSAHTSPAHRKTQAEEIDYEDETYFKRRPKTICYTDPRRLASLDDSLSRSGRVPRPRSEVAPNTASQYDSYLSDDAHPDDAAARRPTQLAITSSEYHSTEIFPEDSTREGNSVDFLEGYTLRRTAYTQPNTPDLGHSARFRQATTPEAFLDDRPQKHVSFQKAMSRSATVGGLEEHMGLTFEDNGRGAGKSGGSRSEERLLDGRRSPDYVEQRALDHLLAPVLTKALLQEPGNKKHGKHPREVSKRSGGQEVDSEAGSRSRSRTPSLRRKKTEKRTISIQTDEVLGCSDQWEGQELGSWGGKGGQQAGPGEEAEVADKKAAKRKKSKNKEAAAVKFEKPTRKETVHFSDQHETIHVDCSGGQDQPPRRSRKKPVVPQDGIPKSTFGKSLSSTAAAGQGVASERRQLGGDDNKVSGHPASVGVKKSASQVSKISMGMQTESVAPFVFNNPIFMTEDLDTSTDWQGEESSIDWQTSASSLAWHTDRSSFNWQTDTSSYTRHLDASSLSCKDDISSFAPDSQEETDEEDMLNMNINMIRRRRQKQSPGVPVTENVAWDGGGSEGGRPLDRITECEVDPTPDVMKYYTVNPSKAIKKGDEQNTEKGKDVDEEGISESRERKNINSQDSRQHSDDQGADAMLRRLRFRRQMAEEFLQHRAAETKGLSTSARGLEGAAPPLTTSTFPRKAEREIKSQKLLGIPQEYFEDWEGKVPLETCRTWPKRSVDSERSDDIDLRGFKMICDPRVCDRRKAGHQQLPHKTSHIEINLVYKEEQKNQRKCVKISNSETVINFKPTEKVNVVKESKSDQKLIRTVESPKFDSKEKNEDNSKTRKNKSEAITMSLDRKPKKSQPAEISDEYPRSDTDFRMPPSGSPSGKKYSSRADVTKNILRKKKSSQKDLSESPVAQKASKTQDSSKTKEGTMEQKRGKQKDQLSEPARRERNLLCYTTDTSSTLTNTDSVGRRVKRVKKKTLAIQTEESGTVISEQKEETEEAAGTGREKIVEEPTRLKVLPLKDSEVVKENESAKENESSTSAVTSLRRKRSVKRKTKSIQTGVSLEDPENIPSPSVQDLITAKKPVVKEAVIFIPPLGDGEAGRKTPNTLQTSRERLTQLDNRMAEPNINQDNTSINTNTSSLRRMRKVRKTTVTTQTDDYLTPFLPDTFPQDAQPDSVSVRTNSLRRMRKAEKRTVEIQTDEVIPVNFQNLDLTLAELTGYAEDRGALLGVPQHSDSLIYVNIPAALLEVSESGNDADVSEAESEDGETYARGAAMRIYSRVTEEDEEDLILDMESRRDNLIGGNEVTVSRLNITYGIEREIEIEREDGESDDDDTGAPDGESDHDGDAGGAPDGESDQEIDSVAPGVESDHYHSTGAPDGESDHDNDTGVPDGESDQEGDIGAPDGESDHEGDQTTTQDDENEQDVLGDTETDNPDGEYDDSEAHQEDETESSQFLTRSFIPPVINVEPVAESDEGDSDEDIGDIYVVTYHQREEIENGYDYDILEDEDEPHLDTRVPFEREQKDIGNGEEEEKVRETYYEKESQEYERGERKEGEDKQQEDSAGEEDREIKLKVRRVGSMDVELESEDIRRADGQSVDYEELDKKMNLDNVEEMKERGRDEDKCVDEEDEKTACTERKGDGKTEERAIRDSIEETEILEEGEEAASGTHSLPSQQITEGTSEGALINLSVPGIAHTGEEEKGNERLISENIVDYDNLGRGADEENTADERERQQQEQASDTTTKIPEGVFKAQAMRNASPDSCGEEKEKTTTVITGENNGEKRTILGKMKFQKTATHHETRSFVDSREEVEVYDEDPRVGADKDLTTGSLHNVKESLVSVQEMVSEEQTLEPDRDDPLTTIVCDDPLTTAVCDDPLTTIVCDDPLTTAVCDDPLTTAVCDDPLTTAVCDVIPQSVMTH